MWSGRKKARRKLRSNSFPASQARASRKVFPGKEQHASLLCSLACTQCKQAQCTLDQRYIFFVQKINSFIRFKDDFFLVERQKISRLPQILNCFVVFSGLKAKNTVIP